MVYVRSKKIKGNTYYYLVKTVREKSKVRQIVLDYLGNKKPAEETIKKIAKDKSGQS